MIKNTNLLSYLPPFMADFLEIRTALEAENQEFDLVRNEIQRILQNSFIDSADEYGINRFERMLGILPHVDDTMPERRARILSRHRKNTFYTKYELGRILETICGKDRYKLQIIPDTYTVKIKIHYSVPMKFSDIKNILYEILPCNMELEMEGFIIWKKLGVYMWNEISDRTWNELNEEEEISG